MIVSSSRAHEDYVKLFTEEVHTKEYEVSGKQATSLTMQTISDVLWMANK